MSLQNVGSVEPVDMKAVGWHPELEGNLDPFRKDAPPVTMIVYHEEWRQIKHHYISLNDPKAREKADELEKQGLILEGQDQLNYHYKEPDRRPKGYVCKFTGQLRELSEWWFGDEFGEGKHLRTWMVPPECQTDMKAAVKYVKSIRYKKGAFFSEVNEVTWEELKVMM